MFQRLGVVAAAAALPLNMVGDAWAGERFSYIKGALPGFESTRWTDDGGTGDTKVEFTSCTANGGDTPFDSTHVQLFKVIDYWPDKQYGSTRKFTACKTGTSVGLYPAMSNGDRMYFKISRINDSTGVIHLDVAKTRVAY
ncbi:hypothetical protein GCM10009716_15170 [Streptomyces sodiiphilus]|uniref:Uncharacterized protein n=2 Tax=Streptomyces sodiiphilus TaxID=226217 RepID=A0ABN2NZ87_9ACTN